MISLRSIWSSSTTSSHCWRTAWPSASTRPADRGKSLPLRRTVHTWLPWKCIWWMTAPTLTSRISCPVPTLARASGAAEGAYVDLPGGAGRQGLLEGCPGVRCVVGHREGTEAAAVVEHEVPRHGRCRDGVDDLAGPGPRRPHRVHVLAEPDPLPLELRLARAELPLRTGRHDDEHAVQPEDPLDGPSPGVVVDVRAGGRRLEGQRGGGARRDRARVRDSVDAECVRLRQPVVHPKPHGAADLRDDRPVGEEAGPELPADEVLAGQRRDAVPAGPAAPPRAAPRRAGSCGCSPGARRRGTPAG